MSAYSGVKLAPSKAAEALTPSVYGVSGNTPQRHKPCEGDRRRNVRRRSRMSTPIAILWTLLSVMVAGTCSFSFLQPYWFIHPDNLNSLGMYSYCVGDARQTPPEQVCGIYGGSFHFSNLPSNAWQASCVLFGGGCAFLCLAALLAMTSLCLPRVADKRLAVFTGYIQTMAGKEALNILYFATLTSLEHHDISYH